MYPEYIFKMLHIKGDFRDKSFIFFLYNQPKTKKSLWIIAPSSFYHFRQVMYMYLKQARIQEFSSEGVQLSENLDKQKKKKKGGGQKTEEKTEGCGCSSPSADVIDFPDNYLHTSFFSVGHGLLYNCKPSLHKHKDDMVVL